MNLPEVQKLLGYSTGPENQTDKEADITNVMQVPDQPQVQQQTVQQDQSQPMVVTQWHRSLRCPRYQYNNNNRWLLPLLMFQYNRYQCKGSWPVFQCHNSTCRRGCQQQTTKIWIYHTSYLIHIENNSY